MSVQLVRIMGRQWPGLDYQIVLRQVSLTNNVGSMLRDEDNKSSLSTVVSEIPSRAVVVANGVRMGHPKTLLG